MGGFNLPYRGGSVFNKGVQYTMDVNRPRVQFTMGFKIPYDTGKSARQGNLRHPRVSEISLSCTFYQCLILFLTFIISCVLFDSYILLSDDHVNNVSYFSFMSIKKVIPYFCVLHEGYYVMIWLIVRICVFIKDWKLIYSELFILKRKSMENSGGQLT
jgi:hypothetical protein